MHKIKARPVVERVESPIPRRFNQIKGEQSAQLIADYQAGMPVKEMATMYGIHRGSVSKHLREHGVPPRKVGLDAAQIQEAIKLYVQGESLAVIGKRMGVDKGTVRQRLVEMGVEMRSPHEHLTGGRMTSRQSSFE